MCTAVLASAAGDIRVGIILTQSQVSGNWKIADITIRLPNEE
jgi:hypothetical protein